MAYKSIPSELSVIARHLEESFALKKTEAMHYAAIYGHGTYIRDYKHTNVLTRLKSL